MTPLVTYNPIKLLDSVNVFGPGPAIPINPQMMGRRTVFVYGTNFESGNILIEYSPDGINFWTALEGNMLEPGNDPIPPIAGLLLLDDGGFLELDNMGFLSIVPSGQISINSNFISIIKDLPLGYYVRANLVGAGSPAPINISVAIA